MSPHLRTGIAILVTLCISQSAWAKDPSFKYAEEPEATEKDEVKWTAQAQAGLLLTTGNSATTTLSSGFQASRKAGNNKFVLDLAGAFARASIDVAADFNNNGFVDEVEVDRITRTSSRFWLAKPRYDRFLSKRNALYVATAISSDKPAGKTLIGSGQLGYSRNLLTSKVHAITLESGYDFSFEDLEASGPGLSIHSIRVFAGYEGKLSKDTALNFSIESLFNLNKLTTPTGPVDAGGDTRLENKVSLTTSLYGNLSFRFSFLARYDSAPAPRPKLSLPYAVGFQPVADRLDTRTEAALIVNFL